MLGARMHHRGTDKLHINGELEFGISGGQKLGDLDVPIPTMAMGSWMYASCGEKVESAILEVKGGRRGRNVVLRIIQAGDELRIRRV